MTSRTTTICNPPLHTYIHTPTALVEVNYQLVLFIADISHVGERHDTLSSSQPERRAHRATPTEVTPQHQNAKRQDRHVSATSIIIGTSIFQSDIAIFRTFMITKIQR